MKTTLRFGDFWEYLNVKNSSYSAHFSYDGAKALFNYLKDYEDSTGESIEFDLIALCCDYDEYDSVAEALDEYEDINTLEELEDQTTVIKINNDDGVYNGGVIIQSF